MQSVCLLFAGRRGLDDFSMRSSIVRVPEVSQRLKRAQSIFDQTGKPVDLFAFAQASDTEYANLPNLRVLLASIVQIGLYDRYIKFRNPPTFMVGKTNGSSALDVCTQKITFDEFITSSDFFLEITNVEDIDSSKTTLTGLRLEEYGAVILKDGTYTPFQSNSKDCYSIIQELGSESIISQYIHIGPCFDFRQPELEKNGMSYLSIMNSIDTDPMLSSFWKAPIAI